MLQSFRERVGPHSHWNWNHNLLDRKHHSKEEENHSESSSSRRSSKHSKNMGNHLSSESCTSGFEKSKNDLLTTATTDEEIRDYAKNQEHLETEDSKEAASEAMASSSSLSVDDTNPSRGSQSDSPRRRSKRLSMNSVKRKGHKVFDKIGSAFHSAGHAVGQKLHHFEGFIFPSHHRQPTSLHVAPKVRGGVLLRGCLDDDEHRYRVRAYVEILKELEGADALKAIGLEYRRVPVNFENSDKENDAYHGMPGNPDLADEKENSDGMPDIPDLADEKENTTLDTSTMQLDEENMTENVAPYKNKEMETTSTLQESYIEPKKDEGFAENDTDGTGLDPEMIMTRLFHTKSNTMITQKNRKQFIADGDMYNAVAKACQEYAQDLMIREGGLEWVTVCDAGNNPEPIRALVSKSISEDECNLDKNPTLLIATGKGKVRAGIFSRQHLMLSGIECSTAVPIVRDAEKRNMNVVMLDPNVHGDRLGMVTFEKSMSRLFRRWEQDETCSSEKPPFAHRDLYVLSHSQSGAQFARYLLEKSEHYVSHIRAVAFTDSTHNIQWARQNENLHQLLQSDTCVYWRVSKEPSDRLEPLNSLGQEVETDQHWKRRFGGIKTRCAGTSDHSLTNWFARSHIWEHFDSFLHRNSHSSHETS